MTEELVDISQLKIALKTVPKAMLKLVNDADPVELFTMGEVFIETETDDKKWKVTVTVEALEGD